VLGTGGLVTSALFPDARLQQPRDLDSIYHLCPTSPSAAPFVGSTQTPRRVHHRPDEAGHHFEGASVSPSSRQGTTTWACPSRPGPGRLPSPRATPSSITSTSSRLLAIQFRGDWLLRPEFMEQYYPRRLDQELPMDVFLLPQAPGGRRGADPALPFPAQSPGHQQRHFTVAFEVEPHPTNPRSSATARLATPPRRQLPSSAEHRRWPSFPAHPRDARGRNDSASGSRPALPAEGTRHLPTRSSTAATSFRNSTTLSAGPVSRSSLLPVGAYPPYSDSPPFAIPPARGAGASPSTPPLEKWTIGRVGSVRPATASAT